MEETNTNSTTNLDLIMEVEVPISVRFGLTEMLLEEVAKLSHGSVIQLDRLADEPVEFLVNGKLLALGEVVVADGHYAIRITEVESPADRVRSLGT